MAAQGKQTKGKQQLCLSKIVLFCLCLAHRHYDVYYAQAAFDQQPQLVLKLCLEAPRILRLPPQGVAGGVRAPRGRRLGVVIVITVDSNKHIHSNVNSSKTNSNSNNSNDSNNSINSNDNSGNNSNNEGAGGGGSASGWARPRPIHRRRVRRLRVVDFRFLENPLWT